MTANCKEPEENHYKQRMEKSTAGSRGDGRRKGPLAEIVKKKGKKKGFFLDRGSPMGKGGVRTPENRKKKSVRRTTRVVGGRGRKATAGAPKNWKVGESLLLRRNSVRKKQKRKP